jgi:hypothetical protein
LANSYNRDIVTPESPTMSCAGSTDNPIVLPAAVAALDEQTRLELEAAAFRGLVAHLQRRTDAQNIDLMNLAGFCRNCLSKWYLNAAKERGVGVDYDLAREVVYGMPYNDWKKKFQTEATPEQQRRFEESTPLHAFVSGHHKG